MLLNRYRAYPLEKTAAQLALRCHYFPHLLPFVNPWPPSPTYRTCARNLGQSASTGQAFPSRRFSGRGSWQRITGAATVGGSSCIEFATFSFRTGGNIPHHLPPGAPCRNKHAEWGFPLKCVNVVFLVFGYINFVSDQMPVQQGAGGGGSAGAVPTVSWPEYAAIETGDVVVTVEHCHGCHRHRMTTRHDAEVSKVGDRVFVDSCSSAYHVLSTIES